MKETKETLPGQGFLDSVRRKLEAEVLEAEAKIGLYLNNPVGVGEHPDIIEAIEQELDEIARYNDQVEMLNKYFPQ